MIWLGRKHLPPAMLAPEAIDRAWRRLRRDMAPWSESVDQTALHAHLPLHLVALVRELEAGTYRPGPIRQTRIVRPDGQERIISRHFLRDKFAQRLAVECLEPLGERLFHPDSHGYRRGRGPQTALRVARERLHTGRRWLVDADIRSFFDNVPHRRLRRHVALIIPEPGLRRLIDLWLASGPSAGNVLEGRRGLLQGAVISPWLCNLYLDTLDRAWTDASIPFVRFADDFLLFARSRREAEQALAFTRHRLEKLGLALHPEKTRVVHAERAPPFLGEHLLGRRHGPRSERP